MKWIAVMFLLASVSFAQGTRPTDDLSAMARQVKTGQTRNEIVGILGDADIRPGSAPGWSCGSKKMKSDICWTLTPHDTLVVTFKDNRATRIAHADLSAQGWSRPSRIPEIPADAPPKLIPGADTLWWSHLTDGTVLTTWRATTPEETAAGVTTEFDVGENGVPTNIRVQTSRADLEQLAKYAVNQWRFHPAIKSGHAETTIGLQVVLFFRSESAERAFARQQYEQATSLYHQTLLKKQEYIDAVASMQSKWFKDVDQMSAYLEEAKRLGVLLDQAKPQLDLMKARMENADSCVQVYRDTIDKKNADLTTRESQSIQGCQYLGIYPPPTK